MLPVDQLTFISFAGGATLSLCTFLVGLVLFKRRQISPPFLMASLLGTVWCTVYMFAGWNYALSPLEILILESARYSAWFYCLLATMRRFSGKRLPLRLRRTLFLTWTGLFLYNLYTILSTQNGWGDSATLAGTSLAETSENGELLLSEHGGIPLIWNSLLMTILCLVGVEQLFRNAPTARTGKILSVCVGAFLIFDLYLFSITLLQQHISASLWSARGFTYGLSNAVLSVGLLTTADQDGRQANLSISRPIVFYTTSLTAAGVFLAMMALGGYYVKSFGGEWGTVLQAVLTFASLIMVATAFVSESIRTSLAVLVDKHFFHHKYDYRAEWLRLISRLSEPSDDDLSRRALSVVNEIFKSHGGCLWLNNNYGKFVPVASEQMNIPSDALEEPETSEFCRIMTEKDWVFVPSATADDDQANYNRALPQWMTRFPKLWAIVPLRIDKKLYGFILLLPPTHRERLSWEDLDLLKTVGSQVASYLARHEAAELLSQSKQFEAYNKLTAFIMHDLKNLIAQQALVVENAGKHKMNPAFIEDAITTIDNSVQRMSKLLKKLQQSQPAANSTFNIQKILLDATQKCQGKAPRPSLRIVDQQLMVTTDQEHLEMVIIHIIKNAQEATSQDGFVDVTLSQKGQDAIILVEDNGEGMDADFIKNRLFRPFDTTKSGKGMGIGAFQTREFIRSLGGDITVQSTPRVGTAFKIIIPLSNELPLVAEAPAGSSNVEPRARQTITTPATSERLPGNHG
ncbi:Two-component signal transduction histidine kinase [gamma proteobacterium HdN1]|nr:Two-component signal transduction histidine kinase [gamma proteobacterium HdN1]